MVLDPRKRQKKLERKAAKRNTQLKTVARQDPTNVRVRFQNSVRAPVVHSLAIDSLWKEGMGYVLLSRELNQHQLAFSVFLVDMYCLGVKNVMWNILPRGQVAALVEKLARDHKIVKLKPECTRSLVEGAVEYARNLGFAPHDDYQRGKLIFGDIDGTACTESFVYGQDGKPLFIAGPHDSPQRCQQIINGLNARLGPQGHHFMVPLHEGDSPLNLIESTDGDRDEDE